jgi:hypothetical protein
MVPHLLYHAQTIPTGADRFQNAIVDGPGTTSHGAPLVRLAKRRAAVQGLVQASARLEPPMDLVHQFVAAHVGESPPLKQPG